MAKTFLGAGQCSKINHAIKKAKYNAATNRDYKTNRYVFVTATLGSAGLWQILSVNPIPTSAEKQVYLGSIYYLKRFLDTWKTNF